MAANVPLSVLTAPETNYQFGAAIGSQTIYPEHLEKNTYWFAIVDRYDLSVVVNTTSKSNSDVPADVVKYSSDARYMLIVSTLGLTTPQLPQGALRKLLSENGGAGDLNRLEQVYQQFSCGEFGFCNFACVGVMGDSDVGYATSSFSSFDRNVLTLTLNASSIDGKTIYTPVANASHTYTPVS